MIRVLEDRVVNKIAAGEVVERPASACKELVENALDAGATQLRVELAGGGRTLVRVVDNGSGMDRADATLCLERHATSKIRSDADLFTIGTLGFRGEAIPSIASVSRFELRTRTAGTDVGTRVLVEGGVLQTIEDVGCPVGSDVSVRALFFNVPARRKFLKTVPTELSHCVEAVVRQALIRPDLDLELLHEGEMSIRAPRVNSRAARAADLLGPHGQALVAVEKVQGDIEIEALISPVGVHRADAAAATYLFVNGRFVRDPVIRRAVTEAYKGIVPKERYPTVVLELRLPPGEVDVNVHPAKTEVRFPDGRRIGNLLTEALREGLERHGIKRPVEFYDGKPRTPLVPPAEQVGLPVPRPPERLFVAEPERIVEPTRPSALPPPSLPSRPPTPALPPAPRPAVVAPIPPPPSVSPATPVPSPPPAPPAPPPVAPSPAAWAPDPRGLLPVRRFVDLQVLGQVARTYIICEGGGELIIVDQHAAHERITLYRLMRAAREKLGGGQRLLNPPVIELPLAQARALEPHLDLLNRYGLEVEPFGDRAFAVKQVPEALAKADPARLLRDVADDIAGGGSGAPLDQLVEHLLATMACHSSIRAGQPLSPYEMKELLRGLDEVDFSVCAHGRPVVLRIAPGELERRFHRA